jgi:protein SCO1
MRHKPWLAMTAGALLVTLPVGRATVLAHEMKPATTAAGAIGIAANPSLALIKPAPDFALVDTADQRFALSQLRGRVAVLSFVYTSCTTTCPLLTQQMVLLEDRLKRAGLWASSVSFVSVTIDPERDTAPVLKDYAQQFGATDANWRFLRERPAQLQPVLAAYDEWTKRLSDGDIDHPARVYLIDRQGIIREIYGLSFFEERQVFIDIQTLLQEPNAHSG